MLWALSALAFSAGGAHAQESARARAQLTLPPAVYAELDALATNLAPEGVPSEPLYAKALEGAAKRVPPDRIVPAVRNYAMRLGEARQALGTSAAVPLLVAGADALQRGVSREALRSLSSDRPRSPLALLALAELVESGVPPERAIAILRDVMAQSTNDGGMLDVAARVRRLVRQGATPQEALDRVLRALQRERARVGPAVPPGSEPILRDRPRLRGGN
jgi:hypothetical protein